MKKLTFYIVSWKCTWRVIILLYSSIPFLPTIRVVEPIPTVIRQEVEYSMDRLPVYGRANAERQATSRVAPTANLESPINLTCMFLNFTIQSTQKKSTQIQEEHPKASASTQNLLAAMRPTHHHIHFQNI